MSAAATKVPTGTWNVDPSHSSVEFQVKHLGIATVKGSFKEFAGSLTAADDGSITASGTVEVATVDTREAQRDDHLRSADFFDVENNPQITFTSTGIEHLDEETFKITGDITIHGVTKPITLEAVVDGTEEDPWGNQRVGLSATGQLSRGDFGMKFNQALGSGNVVVSDKVKLAIDISAVRA
jgi:polyisoprenoid-binding protein YceI